MTAGFEEKYWEVDEQKRRYYDTLERANAHSNVADFWEYCCSLHGDAPCVTSVHTGESYTFNEIDRLSNRVAHWARRELRPEAGLSFLCQNCPQYLACILGFAKAGRTPALINTHLSGHSLESVLMRDRWGDQVVYSDRFEHVARNLQCPHSFRVEDVLEAEEVSQSRPPTGWRTDVRERDAVFYIFTSGTTGRSKPAIFSHRRFIGAACQWGAASALRKGDAYYICLPLFHGNAGVVAVAPCYMLGCHIILREKFSRSQFYPDVIRYRCTGMIYIGELWRYLGTLSKAEKMKAREQSRLRTIIGNGLSVDLWRKTVSDFGIEHVVEHYGSTEMPGDAILNFMQRAGSCGYIPMGLQTLRQSKGEGGLLVQYDLDLETIRRPVSLCKPGEVGELIMRLPGGKYDGYFGCGLREETEAKLVRDVLAEGDCWWRSGDLLKVDREGFFYFIDRTGDTFRWKGENVATIEVAGVLNNVAGIKEALVYGVKVPHCDGRAGMAALVLEDEYKGTAMEEELLPRISEAVVRDLPAYARPIFLRVMKEHSLTATLKYKKHDRRQEGYKVSESGDALYVVVGGKWVAQNEELELALDEGSLLALGWRESARTKE